MRFQEVNMNIEYNVYSLVVTVKLPERVQTRAYLCSKDYATIGAGESG